MIIKLVVTRYIICYYDMPVKSKKEFQIFEKKFVLSKFDLQILNINLLDLKENFSQHFFCFSKLNNKKRAIVIMSRDIVSFYKMEREICFFCFRMSQFLKSNMIILRISCLYVIQKKLRSV